MSGIMSVHIKVVLLLSAIAWHTCKGGRGDDGAIDCCLDVSHIKIPRAIVKACQVQHTAMGCRISAVIFTTVRNRKLCAPQGPRWVNRILKKCERHNTLLV
ncbi:C-C motif chemokine 19-like [Chiloscyllium plagiosum]|uniref:C-C motif chemokine 19-like n=1 Tax=Chiloscyllium plagiosum TaxID=36176 RepID=UPI001CB86996|nr:C-C motif chemokine 19-like [Chiloscyllium plagiosum]